MILVDIDIVLDSCMTQYDDQSRIRNHTQYARPRRTRYSLRHQTNGRDENQYALTPSTPYPPLLTTLSIFTFITPRNPTQRPHNRHRALRTPTLRLQTTRRNDRLNRPTPRPRLLPLPPRPPPIPQPRHPTPTNPKQRRERRVPHPPRIPTSLESGEYEDTEV